LRRAQRTGGGVLGPAGQGRSVPGGPKLRGTRGTGGCLAPERVRGAEGGHRPEILSAGAILY